MIDGFLGLVVAGMRLWGCLGDPVQGILFSRDLSNSEFARFGAIIKRSW